MPHTHNDMVKSESSLREYFKFGLVIWLIFLSSIWLTFADGLAQNGEWMRFFMGAFLGTFGVFKLIGYDMFPDMFAEYDIIARRQRFYAQTYPFIELGLGLLYLFDLGGMTRDIITLLVGSIGSVGVWRAIAARRGVHCACLGNVIKLPLSTVSLVEDLGMSAMALVMLFG